jgi:hypothetical protein
MAASTHTEKRIIIALHDTEASAAKRGGKKCPLQRRNAPFRQKEIKFRQQIRRNTAVKIKCVSGGARLQSDSRSVETACPWGGCVFSVAYATSCVVNDDGR